MIAASYKAWVPSIEMPKLFLSRFETVASGFWGFTLLPRLSYFSLADPAVLRHLHMSAPNTTRDIRIKGNAEKACSVRVDGPRRLISLDHPHACSQPIQESRCQLNWETSWWYMHVETDSFQTAIAYSSTISPAVDVISTIDVLAAVPVIYLSTALAADTK